YHEGLFYVLFVALETHTTYLYTTKDMNKPWKRRTIEGFYHDASLLFDGERVFITYGNGDIHLTELKKDLSGPLPGGFDEVIISDNHNPILGYEGSHIYHIGDYYYVFLIHSLRDEWMRVEACFRSKHVEGPYEGKDILNDTRDYCSQGVAQGGIVEDAKGNWWGILFQDHGAVGRIPVLVPIHWEEGWPVLGENGRVPDQFRVPGEDGDLHSEADTKKSVPDVNSLYQSDDFGAPSNVSEATLRKNYGSYGFRSCWQFNHEPTLPLVGRRNHTLFITTGKICQTVTDAQNTLTQRALFPACAAEVTLDASRLKVGDTAGLCALQGCYGFVGLRRTKDGLFIVMEHKKASEDPSKPQDPHAPGITEACIPFDGKKLRLAVSLNFDRMRDEATFIYEENGAWKQIGPKHKLYFKLDHFTGCRFGLFAYATETIGGTAGFSKFVYLDQELSI
nr:family 43 glycosylhydrolase [Lachnospiraceae bacterium]